MIVYMYYCCLYNCSSIFYNKLLEIFFFKCHFLIFVIVFLEILINPFGGLKKREGPCEKNVGILIQGGR